MQLEAPEGLWRPKVPPGEEMKNFNGKLAGFRCTGRAEWGQFAAAGPHGLRGESEMPNADDDAPKDIYSMSREEAMHEAALELNKTATPLYRATRLSEEAWALIEQNVAETRTLTENYIEKVKSINQIQPGTPEVDQPIICDPLLDEMRTAASHSFLVYQYKLQILLDKAIAKKIKKKRKDEKAL